jgi:two-component system sensor histidine kinase ChvG
VSWATVRGWRPSRIGLRLLAFNLLVVFVPVVGVLYLTVYETRLLRMQEVSMVQQGRLLEAALAGAPALDAESASALLARIEPKGDARYRVYDAQGVLLADSARGRPPAPVEKADRYEPTPDVDVRDRLLYRIGAWLANSRKAVRSWLPRSAGETGVDESNERQPEIQAALAGRYGSATRPTPGQRSVTMYSALPIQRAQAVAGAVVVSQSTFRILQALYDVRLRIFRVVVASLVAAAALTGIASMTIVGPLSRLRARASALADRRMPLPAGFPEAGRSDELGALARALEEMTRRVNDHVELVQSFAADVSHEFKNPLASIRIAAEMVAVADTESDRQRFLTLLTRDVDRLERLVTGLREMAIVGERIEQEPTEAVDLKPLLEDIARRFELSDGHRVEVAADRGGRQALVRGSRERLAQVFENLVGNAVSFSPNREPVTIDLSGRGRSWVVTVEDRGPGLPKGHLDRIFGRFFTYRPGHQRDHHVGLGLAIAKQIVDGYGGTITASNRSEGGARFEVSLPVTTAAHTTINRSAAIAANPSNR